MKPGQRVAVIGAGLAGLTCATTLQQAGARVCVFDKSRGPSGRISTRRGDGWQCDHGAQYFTARDPDFRAQVARWQQAGLVDVWTPRLQVIGQGPSAAGETGLQRYVGMPMMTAPAQAMASGLDFEASTTIDQLQRGADGWQLHSKEHGWLDGRYHAVMLAVPAPQAATLLRETSAALASLAAGVVMRPCWALMLRYDAPLALDFDAAFVHGSPLRWVARNNSKPGRDRQEIWILHADAAWSEAHLELAPEQVTTQLVAAFQALGAPAPAAAVAHRWRYADALPGLEQECAWQAGERLGLCGDWLHTGKVEGAWLSGRHLAHRILQDCA